ncbi:MAG: hypothetical protein AABZ10_13900 [Nitrospirota bacterium]
MSANFKLKWIKEGNTMKYAKTISTVLLLASLLTACGGGGGGGGGGGSTPLATGTFTKAFAPTPTGRSIDPFSADDAKVQQLYLASEISGAGNITTLRFQRNALNAASVTCPNTTIKLGHTGAAALASTTFALNMDNGRGSSLTVLNNATVTIPADAAGAWFDIPLTTPFQYNGVDNLVVQSEHTTACSAALFVNSIDAATNRKALSFAADTTPGTAQHDTTTASSLSTVQPLMQFAFAGGDDKIDLGGAGSNSWPFALAVGGVSERPRIQNLYLASEINGSGPVTGIAFQVNATSPGSNYTYSLKLGHSTLAALGNTFADNYSDSPTTVANAVTFSIPAGIPAGEWVWVPIPNGVFTYNGTDNLIVEVATSSGTASTLLRYASIAGRRVWVNDTTGTATFGTVDPAVNHIALRFNGGTLDVNTPAGMSGSGITFPFYNTDGKLQVLYRASELGSKGAISKIACRSQANSAAESGFTYSVVMSHSTAPTLGVMFADNLPSPVTVFSGALSVSAVLRGDWLEIPLSSPFAYNGRDNLVVEISGTGGTPANALCVSDGTSALYAARGLWAGTAGATMGDSFDNGLLDMRFTVQ